MFGRAAGSAQALAAAPAKGTTGANAVAHADQHQQAAANMQAEQQFGSATSNGPKAEAEAAQMTASGSRAGAGRKRARDGSNSAPMASDAALPASDQAANNTASMCTVEPKTSRSPQTKRQDVAKGGQRHKDINGGKSSSSQQTMAAFLAKPPR